MSLLDPKHAKEVAALLREAKAGLVADTKGLTAEMEAVSGPTTATVGAHTLPIAGFEAKNLVPKEKLKEIAKLKAGDARWPGFNLLVNPGALGRQVGKKLGYEMYEQAPNLHLPEIEKQQTSGANYVLKKSGVKTYNDEEQEQFLNNGYEVVNPLKSKGEYFNYKTKQKEKLSLLEHQTKFLRKFFYQMWQAQLCFMVLEQVKQLQQLLRHITIYHYIQMVK